MSRMRVILVGLGPLGIRMGQDLERRGLGRVVAAVDPRFAGEEVGSWTAVGTLDETPEADAAIVATVSDLAACAPTLRALLERGLTVVSTCEELAEPWLRHAVLADELDALARARGAVLLGTGVNPGFVMDALPVALTSVCHAVRRIEIHRIQDAALRRLPFQAKIGATFSVEDFEARVAAGDVRHVGLGESVSLIGRALGLTFDRVDETIAPVIADAPMTCGLGAIDAGAVRGVHQEARAFAGGREVIALVFHAAIGEPDPRDRVLVEGEPDLELIIPGGVPGDIATSAITLNALAGLRARREPPGLRLVTTTALGGCAPGSPSGAPAQ